MSILLRSRGLQLLVLAVACLPLLVRVNAAPDPGLRGLEPVTAGLCAGGFRIDAVGDACTHGPDGLDAPRREAASTAELRQLATQAGDWEFACDGNGTSGRRVHMIYAHTTEKASRYDAILGGLRGVVAQIQDDFGDSVERLGGTTRLVPRFTHSAPGADGSCVPSVDEVQLAATADDSFGATIQALQAKGYTNPEYRYLVMFDATSICGIGQFWDDDRPDPALNFNNIVHEPLFSRVDATCWAYAETHELVHNLGGVQTSAPNATGFGHCNDDFDQLCYADGGPDSAMYVASGCENQATDERLLDCNGDDYFHPDPPAGSYLATHWNVADSSWLFSPAKQVVTPGLSVTGAELVGDVVTLRGTVSNGSSAVASVEVRKNGVLGTAAAGAGPWELAFTLPEGIESVKVVAVAEDGTESTAVTVTVASLDATVPEGWIWGDVDPTGSVHGDNIARLSVGDVLDGCSDTDYCPSDALARRDMARFLARALELDPVIGDFDDVPFDDVDAGWIGAVAAAGISQGLGDGTFDPEGTVTRGQMARFLATGFALAPGVPDFDDVAPDAVFHDDIGALVAARITSGCGDGSSYCGSAQVTRGQIATFLAAALDGAAESAE